MIIKRNKLFSLWNKVLTWADKYNAKRGCHSNLSGNTKLNSSELYKLSQKQKEEDIRKALDSVSPYHKALRIAFENSDKFLPKWGDGDEYPNFGMYVEDTEWYKVGDIYTEFQQPNEYRYDGKGWLMTVGPGAPKKISNLKQELLREIKLYRDEYKNSQSLYGWSEEEENDVLNYLNHLEQEIKKIKLQ